MGIEQYLLNGKEDAEIIFNKVIDLSKEKYDLNKLKSALDNDQFEEVRNRILVLTLAGDLDLVDYLTRTLGQDRWEKHNADISKIIEYSGKMGYVNKLRKEVNVGAKAIHLKRGYVSRADIRGTTFDADLQDLSEEEIDHLEGTLSPGLHKFVRPIDLQTDE